MTGEGEHFVAMADFDFTAGSDSEISFEAGDEIRLAPKHLQPRVRGWLLGSSDAAGQTSGLLPANRVRVIGKRLGRPAPQQRRQQDAATGAKKAPDVIEDVFDEAFK